MDYLESIAKITYDNECYVVYIWNSVLFEKVKSRPSIKTVKPDKVVL